MRFLFSVIFVLHFISGFPQVKSKSDLLSLKVMQTGPKSDTHFAFILGYGHSKMNSVELNAGISASRPLSKLIHGAVFVGAGYEYGLDERIDAIKMSMNIHAPINVKLAPILFTDHTHWKIGFRPEVGFAIRKLALTYGYTFVNKTYFENAGGHRLGIRMLIPVYEIKSKRANPYED
jgi:hypothetical protein